MLADLESIEKGACNRRVVLRRWVAAAAAILAMLGVAYFLTTPPRVHVNFTTYPFEATILLDGVEQRGPDGSLLKTPCTIDGLPARQHHVVFRISGLPDLDAKTIDFSATRDIVARWSAAGPANPEDR